MLPSSQRIWKGVFQATRTTVSCFKLSIQTCSSTALWSVTGKQPTFLSRNKKTQREVGKSGRAAWLSDSLYFIPLLAHSFTGPLIDSSFFHRCIHAASTHLSTSPSVHLSIHPLISHPPTRHLSIIHPSCHPVMHF